MFSHSNADIYHICNTKSTAEKHVDLLVTFNSETNHYVWIRDFNKLCYNIIKSKIKKFSCKHCIQHFPSQERLEKRLLNCIVLKECQAIDMPPEGEVIIFKAFRETVKIPFVIYADLESILDKLTFDMQDSDISASEEQEKTEKLQKHIACSYGYKVVCCYDDRLSKPFKMYRGLDSVEKFFTDIFEEEKENPRNVERIPKDPYEFIRRREKST